MQVSGPSLIIHCSLTTLRTTVISSAVICSTTTEKLLVFRAAHSRKNDTRCAWMTRQHRPDTIEENQKHLHIHLRNGITFEVLIITIIQDIIIVESYSLGPDHLREEGEFFFLETLIQPFFFGPLLVLIIDIMIKIQEMKNFHSRHRLSQCRKSRPGQ
jgi:hypothetical protein